MARKEKPRIVKEIEKEEKTFSTMAKKIVDAIKDEKTLRQFTKDCLEKLYRDDPKLFTDHSKIMLKKK